MENAHRAEALIISVALVALGASLGQTVIMGAWRLLRDRRKGDVK